MKRLNEHSSFDKTDLNSEGDNSSRNLKVFSLVMIIVYLILVPVVGVSHAVQLRIKTPQDLAVNNHQYQQFSVCLNDLEKIEQAATGSLIKQKLINGLNCLEKLPISIRDNMTYQNLQSMEQELVDKDTSSYVFSHQDKLSSLVRELDLNLLNKTTTGFVTNTILDSLLVMLSLMLVILLLGSLAMYGSEYLD